MSSASSAARSWFPGQAQVGPLGDDPRALVGLGAVAHDVAQAPELVRWIPVDLGQNGLERGQVRVDVGDHRDSHAADYRR